MASTLNSLTFDETFMIAAGVRGVATGNISMGWDQPPVMFYVYGAAAQIYGAEATSSGLWRPSEDSTVMLPPEVARTLPPRIDASKPVPRWGLYTRYDYARQFFADPRNDPEAIALAARSAAVLVALTLGIMVALFTWRREGELAAVLSVFALMFAPDILAHSSIAWNDLPFATAFFLGLWVWDAALRDPKASRMLTAGAATGLALGVKFSALALGPAAIVLALLEAARRRFDRAWLRQVAMLVPASLVVAWIVLAILYRGDVSLVEFREGVANQLQHAAQGHGVPAFLLGHVGEAGLWYFYPVAMVLKTPIAMLALIPLAVIGFAVTWRNTGWKQVVVESPLRMLPVGIGVYGLLLVRSALAIGVRYALPLLPLFAILIGIGLSRIWQHYGRRMRVTIGALAVAHAALALAYYPWFLTYLSEFVPQRRERGYLTMVDSNIDWGQGLLAVRDFMREENVQSIYLSYFGLVLPESYGIRYSPLPSWMPLPQGQPLPAQPQWVVISATHLQGFYTTDDPFSQFRNRLPDRILANSLYAFRIQ
ncbi:MAG TPA: phospholipid carrier-dependent glycosyltransferase [Gemmatimonadaceae bacterium]